MAESSQDSSRSLGSSLQQQQKQNLPESRARSLGRSRSRVRTQASEFLARKQRLLESSGHLHETDWSTAATANGANDDDDMETHDDDEDISESYKRPQLRRTRRPDSLVGATDQRKHQHHQPQQQEGTDEHQQHQQSSVEAKLESLSELLKNQQQQNEHHLANNEVPLTPTSAKSIDDVYILLAKKEKDLQLAAELGKVLLEKNDELSKANERITEDYSHKLELLEQDKHKLKRKLDLLDGEYENRLIELQTDCNILKNQLDEQQQLSRQAEKEKSKLIDDLVQQNQRLTSELVEATKSEELLSSQLEQMNERFNNRLSNRQDHDAQLEALKEEIHIVNQRKQDLERRLKLANNDKSNLNAALDESGDKIVLLENLLNEKDGKLYELMDEVNELRDSSLWLANELEGMISINEKLAGGTEVAGGHQEVQLAQLLASHERKRAQLIDRLKELRLKNRSRVKANELILINRRATANETQASAATGAGATAVARPTNNGAWARARPGKSNRHRRHGQAALAGSSSLFDEIESSNDGSSANRSSGSTNEYDDDDDDDESSSEGVGGQKRQPWKEETAVEVYLLLRRFQVALQNRKDALVSGSSSSSSSAAAILTQSAVQSYNAGQQHLYSPNSTDDSGISGDDIDKATADDNSEQAKDPAEWRRLLTSLRSLIEEMPCSTCHLMIAERHDYEQLQKLHAKLLDEVRKKNDELLTLNVVKTEQETKLAALEERCAFLSDDLSNCDKPKEEIVKLAWKARDEAVERKNSAEISLAKTRIENMQIASQLMEVVQQKGELSQKLAQFEDDIHYITQDSVKAKFTWEEYAEKLRRSKAMQPDSMANSNPLAQLLNFSVSSSMTTNGASHNNVKSSATELNSTIQPTGLMHNFTANRFNLRFWQRRNSSEKSEDKRVSDNISATNGKPRKPIVSQARLVN